MAAILVFLGLHWFLSLTMHSLYLHRYGSHRMFSMSRGWEKVFAVITYVIQGPSALGVRPYAILHRLHHRHSDTEKDPHSPLYYSNIVAMMLNTFHTFVALQTGKFKVDDPALEEGIPRWIAFDRFESFWWPRLLMAAGYVTFYIYFAPSARWYLLLPVHFVVGPAQGAIVNWCGHKYGYANHKNLGDHSRNTLPIDLITFGELFQNNHHHSPERINFAQRWFEVDIVYLVSRPLFWLGILKPI